jgi:hypothetical protein
MSTFGSSHELGFVETTREFLRKVECREAVNDREREMIFRMRYAAYYREGALPPGAPEIFKDRFDDSLNGATFGFWIDGRLASSMRLHIGNREISDLPAMTVFTDYLQPWFEAGATVVDPTRFVVDAACGRLYPKLPYATVRLAWMACEQFDASLLLATVRTEHQAFYKRLFGHRVVCNARPYPSLAKPISLMVMDFRSQKEQIMRRYPFFRSSEGERRAIFGDWSKLLSEKSLAHAAATAA